MPAASTPICTSSSTGSPTSISSIRNGELSSQSRAPLVFMTGDHRTGSKTRVKKTADVWLYLARANRPAGGHSSSGRGGQTELLERRHVESHDMRYPAALNIENVHLERLVDAGLAVE